MSKRKAHTAEVEAEDSGGESDVGSTGSEGEDKVEPSPPKKRRSLPSQKKFYSGQVSFFLLNNVCKLVYYADKENLAAKRKQLDKLIKSMNKLEHETIQEAKKAKKSSRIIGMHFFLLLS
jgi:hypothetical protein